MSTSQSMCGQISESSDVILPKGIMDIFHLYDCPAIFHILSLQISKMRLRMPSKDGVDFN